MSENQWVCVVCGYNMIGEMPDVCPFCGARHDKFVTAVEAERSYRVTSTRVNERITQLISVPRLGIEHAAYRIETDGAPIWIDCPSAFNRELEPVSAIYFTHKDFMGACNQFRDLWDAKVGIHARDAENPLARQFPVDDAFTGGFEVNGLEAIHIGGHTPGFTMYVFENVLFACDFAFPPGPEMRLNPYSDMDAIRISARNVQAMIDDRSDTLTTVCGYNYVVDLDAWRGDFDRLLEAA